MLCFHILLGWDQSDKFVKIYITDVKGIDGVGADNVKANFTDKYVRIVIIIIIIIGSVIYYCYYYYYCYFSYYCMIILVVVYLFVYCIFRSFSVDLINVGGRNYSLVINGLLNPIDPDKSTVKVQRY